MTPRDEDAPMPKGTSGMSPIIQIMLGVTLILLFCSLAFFMPRLR
jgi:hypothetical protein